ncbi:MAG: hypothetical protein ACE5E8_11990 [Acidimicrobiia bacterium]
MAPAKRRPLRPTVVLAICALLIGALAVPAGAAGAFTDDDGNIHEADIDYIAGLGITAGCNPPANDHYCPGDYVTRAQMASFLVRAFGIDPSATDAFTDDDGNTHEDNIDALAAAGVTAGCNPPANDHYCPGDYVTRAQMASFLVRALTGVTPFHAHVWTDVPQSNTHATTINAISGMKITLGCNPPANTNYCPGDYVTRAQMASFLARALQLGTGRPPVPTITSPANLATFITAFDGGTGLFSVDVTFTATVVDPDGGTPSFAWTSSEQGTLGAGTPLTVTLSIPSGETSSQPWITLITTDSTGLFSGDKIQVKLILPSP